ncbi:MAG: hypothetical protein HFG41_09055 [Coprococcus sp.]|nr:hypothetical protein [Coprococcus sp.]
MEQVLDYSPIGRDDDFFDLGGDSLKAIEFVSKAHNEEIYFKKMIEQQDCILSGAGEGHRRK